MRKKTNAVLVALLASLLLLFVASCSDSTPADTFESTMAPVENKTVNPAKPYDGISWGLFDDQNTSSETTPRDGNDKYAVHTEGKYAVYIPKGLQPKQKTVMVLIPNNTTAKEFAGGEIGQEWMKLAYDRKDFAVAFVEPLDGKTWNETLASEGRDERAFIYDVVKNLKDKSVKEGRPFISVDKNAMSIIGYEEGADMAAVLAASWPALFPNTLLINPVSIEEATVSAMLEEGAYPHIVDGTKAYGTIKNKEIGMPVYVFGDSSEVAKVKAIWNEVNTNAVNADSSLDKDLLTVTELSSDSVSDIYAAAANNNRFMGYAGGTVRERVDFTSDNFEFHWEEKVEGDTVRRWSIYTPDNFNNEEKNPLVVVLHGSSACITDIAEETRWTDIADKEGFAVLFIQGYPRKAAITATRPEQHPYPSWYQGNGNYDYESNIDLQYIDKVVDQVVKARNIDEERIYLTGHSLGAMMTLTVMGSSLADRFAAFGPVGALPAANAAATFADIPFWAMLGQWESAYYSRTSWLTLLGLADTEPTTAEEAGYPAGKYSTDTYLNEGSVPMAKFTTVNDSPHTYMAEEAKLLWYDYFTHFKRVEGATVYTK